MKLRLPVDDLSTFSAGLAQIRGENDVPSGFPAEVVAAAREAAKKPVGAKHLDRTDLPFVTLDPASSTDLDQAFAIETAGSDLVLRYAIADVPWFVEHGSPLDQEAWRRGVTTYLPDGRAPLYPPELSEAAASLLPDGPRPAIVFVVRVHSDGSTNLDAVERAVIRSRAKLAYDTAIAADLPAAFDEFGRRIAAAEDRRGASRVETPEQEILTDADGSFRIEFRPRLANEEANAAMSLATNLAVADALFGQQTGLFRVMPEPDERSIRRLRYSAQGLGLSWPGADDLRTFERTLDPSLPKHAAFLLAVRRATGGADYAPFVAGIVPWHAAMAATYCHSTAPLRRLADRYVVLAALAVASGQAVAETVTEAFANLPKVMDLAESRSSRVERSVIDLVETVMLAGQTGSVFQAVVTDTDERGARIQLCDHAVIARVSANNVAPGDAIGVRLVETNTVKRQLVFERVS